MGRRDATIKALRDLAAPNQGGLIGVGKADSQGRTWLGGGEIGALNAFRRARHLLHANLHPVATGDVGLSSHAGRRTAGRPEQVCFR